MNGYHTSASYEVLRRAVAEVEEHGQCVCCSARVDGGAGHGPLGKEIAEQGAKDLAAVGQHKAQCAAGIIHDESGRKAALNECLAHLALALQKLGVVIFGAHARQGSKSQPEGKA